ncbi:MAG: hypothetical protein ACI4AM_03545, partial [Muribaculaceae bacterium]
GPTVAWANGVCRSEPRHYRPRKVGGDGVQMPGGGRWRAVVLVFFWWGGVGNWDFFANFVVDFAFFDFFVVFALFFGVFWVTFVIGFHNE